MILNMYLQMAPFCRNWKLEFDADHQEIDSHEENNWECDEDSEDKKEFQFGNMNVDGDLYSVSETNDDDETIGDELNGKMKKILHSSGETGQIASTELSYIPLNIGCQTSGCSNFADTTLSFAEETLLPTISRHRKQSFSPTFSRTKGK